MTDPRDALEAIGVIPDTEIDIGNAAIQLARVDAPNADWQAAQAQLSELARDAVAIAKSLGTRDVSMRAEALAGRSLAATHSSATAKPTTIWRMRT